jgi:hypothetical protein
MHHLTKLAAIVLAGSAAAALSACTAAAEQRPTAPQPAGTTSNAAPGPSATSLPTSAPAEDDPTTRVTKPKTATSTGWSTVDWAPAAFEALNCPRLSGVKGADIDSIRYADLTGDGRTDAIVAASCKTTTARNPISIFVYDGTDTRVPLKRLLSIGVHQYLVTADVTVAGRTVSVKSKALSDKAPRCCPDLTIAQGYTWRNGRFAGTSYDEKPL